MVAFSIDIRSLGSPSFCHKAIVVSSVSSVNESRPSVIGIGGFGIIFVFKQVPGSENNIQTSKVRRYGSHSLFKRSNRNCFVKHPTYDMNAVIMSVSPGRVVPWAINLEIENILVCTSEFLSKQNNKLRYSLSPSNIFTSKPTHQTIR